MRIVNYLEKILEAAAVSTLALMMGVQVITIFARYVLKVPIMGSDEIGRFSLVWMTFIGAALSVRNREEIVADFIDRYLTEKGKKIIATISDFLTLIFLAFLFKYGWEMTLFEHGLRTEQMMWPYSVVYVFIPLSALLMAMYIILRRIQDLQKEGGGDNL